MGYYERKGKVWDIMREEVWDIMRERRKYRIL